MTAELWSDLTHQDDLEAQYQALKNHGYDDHDIAVHLARFAEARIITKFDYRMQEVAAEVKTFRQDFIGLIRDEGFWRIE